MRSLEEEPLIKFHKVIRSTNLSCPKHVARSLVDINNIEFELPSIFCFDNVS